MTDAVAQLPPGNPHRIVAELEAVDPLTLTPAQRSILAKSRAAILHERQKTGLKHPSSQPAPARDSENDAPCPDPSSPDALRLLFERAYRAFWKMAASPWEYDATEIQNTVAVFNAARLAYGIGKAAPADESGPLDFSALLGGSKSKKA